MSRARRRRRIWMKLKTSSKLGETGAATVPRERCALSGEPPRHAPSPTHRPPEEDQPKSVPNASPRRARIPNREAAVGVCEGSISRADKEHSPSIRFLRSRQSLHGPQPHRTGSGEVSLLTGQLRDLKATRLTKGAKKRRSTNPKTPYVRLLSDCAVATTACAEVP